MLGTILLLERLSQLDWSHLWRSTVERRLRSVLYAVAPEPPALQCDVDDTEPGESVQDKAWFDYLPDINRGTTSGTSLNRGELAVRLEDIGLVITFTNTQTPGDTKTDAQNTTQDTGLPVEQQQLETIATVEYSCSQVQQQPEPDPSEDMQLYGTDWLPPWPLHLDCTSSSDSDMLATLSPISEESTIVSSSATELTSQTSVHSTVSTPATVTPTLLPSPAPAAPQMHSPTECTTTIELPTCDDGPSESDADAREAASPSEHIMCLPMLFSRSTSSASLASSISSNASLARSESDTIELTAESYESDVSSRAEQQMLLEEEEEEEEGVPDVIELCAAVQHDLPSDSEDSDTSSLCEEIMTMEECRVAAVMEQEHSQRPSDLPSLALPPISSSSSSRPPLVRPTARPPPIPAVRKTVRFDGAQNSEQQMNGHDDVPGTVSPGAAESSSHSSSCTTDTDSDAMDQLNDILTNKSKLEQAFQDAKNRGKKNVVCVDLWVKAGSDGLRNGADPMCQHIFLVLMRKSRDSPTGECQFNVKTVNLYKPHDEFKALGLRNVPVVVFENDAYELIDDIVEFVDSKFPRPALNYFDPDAEEATNDLFSKFAWFIKEVNKDTKALEAELAKIDEHLANEGTKYLTGGSISHLDCRIMPVLHHINVAAGYLKDYTIPEHFPALHAYLKQMYSNEIFRKSAPSDQEVVLYWAERKDTPEVPPAKLAELARQEPTYRHDQYELITEEKKKVESPKKPKAKYL